MSATLANAIMAGEVLAVRQVLIVGGVDPNPRISVAEMTQTLWGNPRRRWLPIELALHTEQPDVLMELLKAGANILHVLELERYVQLAAWRRFWDSTLKQYLASGCTIEPPTASVANGAYIHPITVVLRAYSPRHTIYYTLDGTTPTTASRRYKRPLWLGGSVVLQAISVYGRHCSPTCKAQFYVIGDVNEIDRQRGCPVLHVFIMKGDAPTVEWLLREGADVNQVDRNGLNAVEVAFQCPNQLIQQLVCEAVIDSFLAQRPTVMQFLTMVAPWLPHDLLPLVAEHCTIPAAGALTWTRLESIAPLLTRYSFDLIASLLNLSPPPPPLPPPPPEPAQPLAPAVIIRPLHLNVSSGIASGYEGDVFDVEQILDSASTPFYEMAVLLEKSSQIATRARSEPNQVLATKQLWRKQQKTQKQQETISMLWLTLFFF